MTVAELDGASASSTFELHEPRSLGEALGLLAEAGEDARPIAGGTALSLLMGYGFLRPEVLVSLRHLRDELGGVGSDVTGGLRIGAATTLRELERSTVVADDLPTVASATRHLANVRVRNVATIGGHLAHGDPHMDLPPVFMALDARVRLASARGFRWLPVSELYLGYYETAVADDELITDVLVPAERRDVAAAYRRFTARSVDDWPLLGVAASGWPSGGALTGVRLAVSGVDGRTRRITDAEQLLDADPAGTATFTRAGQLAAAALLGADDTSHLATLVEVEVRRTLQTAFGTEVRP